MADVVELLFFDTFSHESSEELNLDLVQFPKPVFISEVRIIPLGARVQADLPGGVRLGATNPSQFEIEFFVNDLSKPGASTFESLGGLDYKQNGNIHLETERRVPTDGLVLRGWYTTITLAVYGALSRAQEPTTHDATADWVHQLPQPLEASAGERGGYVVEPPSDYGPPLPPAGPTAAAAEPPHHRPRTPPEQQPPPSSSAAPPLVKPDTLETLMSPGDVESISDTELERIGQEAALHEAETPPPGTPPPPPPPAFIVPNEQPEAEQFEPILSDEEIVDDPDQFQDMDYEMVPDEEDLSKTFNPFAFELQPLIALGAPWEARCLWSPCPDAARLEQMLSVDPEPGPDGLEEWLLRAEQLPAMLPHALPCLHHKPEIALRLARWVSLGLDVASAKLQPRPNLKVRHLKAGARLVEAVCACGPRHTAALLGSARLHSRLLDLLEADMMALSVRLMFLRALDASLNCPQAVESLLVESKGSSGYRRLVEMALGPQLARVEFALASILRKLHLHEALAQLRLCAAAIARNPLEQVSEEDAHLSVCALTDTAAILCQAHVLIGQPRRLLPATAQFELTADTHDPYPGLYALLRDQRLLQVLLLLMTSPSAGQRSEVVCAVADVLEALAERRRGLQFLAAHPETAVALTRVLLMGAEDVEMPTALQSLGLRLAYRLQAMELTDRLLHALGDSPQGGADPQEPEAPGGQVQSEEALDALHALFLLALTAPGRAALAHVLCRGQAPPALLSFFGDAADKSPARGYAADLLMLTLRCSDHAPWLLRHGRDLMAAARREEKSQATRLGDAVPWLRPLEKPHSHHDLAPLCETLARCAGSAASVPGELVTCVRLLRHVVTPPASRAPLRQLKHRHALLQLFSLGGAAGLVETLAALGAGLEQPALHSTTLVGAQGLALASLALPTLQLLRRVLTAVIRCRAAAHADLSPVAALLAVHDLLHAFPPSAAGHAVAQAGCREVVDTLLAFTQPSAAETDPVSKSLWTLMMSEVVRHAGSSPHCFVPGLLVLSEMLPLPLPVHARQPLSAEQQLRAVNARTLWSAHLLPLNSALQELVALASASSCAPLLQLARRVCVQLADLAAPSALAVARGLLDPALAALGPEPAPPAEGKEAEEPPCSAHAARQLGFLAGLLAHAPVKAATLHLLASTGKCDVRYSSLVPRLCAVLRRVAADCPAHVLAQEAVIAIGQALCDADVSLAPGGTLPPRAVLSALCSALLEHAAGTSEAGAHSPSTLLPAVRALALLSETDAGFAQLKASLDKSPAALKSLFARLNAGFSASNTALLCAVATSLELLRLCLPGEEEGRSLHLTVPELSAALRWDEEHPVRALEAQLRDSGAEEDVLSLTENLAGLVRLLDEEDKAKPVPPPREWTEPASPTSEPLLAQFAARAVFALGEVEEERLSSSYWLAAPPVDDLDQDVDQVPCDLVALARELLPDLALASETERLCRVPAQAQDAGDKRREVALAAASRNKRPFVAPMRGRGAGRAANQRGDVFRSRPPNTSRPPSLHVDDFVALESSGQQPTGPTGYNKLAMRAAKDMMVVRGRARGRAFSQDRGGRFFPTAPYRRENGASRPAGPWDAPDKFPRFGRGAWPLKEHRERFGARGARREPARHPRTFTR